MKNVLVIGSTGQIGSELTMKIRREIPGSTVVAGYIPGAEPKGELLESGPAELADVRNAAQLADIVERYHIDTIYNLAALLSAVAEKKPLLAWIPPVLSNMAIIPVILIKVYGVPDAWWFLVLTVGAGEIISCGVLGLLLWKSLKNIPQIRGME